MCVDLWAESSVKVAVPVPSRGSQSRAAASAGDRRSGTGESEWWWTGWWKVTRTHPDGQANQSFYYSIPKPNLQSYQRFRNENLALAAKQNTARIILPFLWRE